MFRKLSDFYEVYDDHVQSTKKIFSALTDDILDSRVADGHRSLGGMAWHIVVSIADLMSMIGLPPSSVDPQAPPPQSADEIREAYTKVTDELREAIKSFWNDDTLTLTDNLYGEIWARGKSLLGIIAHEIHHRGQMTVLLRQAGKRVVGVFGPAKEEWAEYGMPEPNY